MITISLVDPTAVDIDEANQRLHTYHADLIQDCQGEHALEHYRTSQTQVPKTETVHSLSQANKKLWWISFSDVVIGYIVTRAQNHKVIVHTIFIERGRRSRGYGKRALTLLAKTLFATSLVSQIEVSVHPQSGAAKKSYRQVGFNTTLEIMTLNRSPSLTPLDNTGS